MPIEHATGTVEPSPAQQPMTREAIQQFLQQPLVAVLSWLTPHREVASSPVWYEHREGKFYVASSSAFFKVRSILKHPAVSLCVQDPTPPYRYVAVRATAEVRADPEAARALDARLAQHYLGPSGARYYTEVVAPTYPGEQRLVVLTPTHITSMDGGAGMSAVAQRTGRRPVA
jgi:PPOX class probable F420-dependent enzyme